MNGNVSVLIIKMHIITVRQRHVAFKTYVFFGKWMLSVDMMHSWLGLQTGGCMWAPPLPLLARHDGMNK